MSRQMPGYASRLDSAMAGGSITKAYAGDGGSTVPTKTSIKSSGDPATSLDTNSLLFTEHLYAPGVGKPGGTGDIGFWAPLTHVETSSPFQRSGIGPAPSEILSKLGLSCESWLRLTRSQRLDSVSVVVRMGARSISSSEVLNELLSGRVLSRMVLDVDNHCLRQGIREIGERQAMNTAFLKPSGLTAAEIAQRDYEARLARENQERLDRIAAQERADRLAEQQRADARTAALLAAASSALGATGAVISAAITSGSEERMTALRIQSEARIRELQAQGGTGSQAQIDALNAVLASLAARQTTPPPPDRTPLYIGLGVAAIAVMGGVMFMATRSRSNPYSTRANVIVRDRKGRKRYMSKAARRRQLARSR